MAVVLSIPPERAPPAAGLEIRPRHVKSWIESLALNVTFESGRRLCAHLAAVNRTHLDNDTRLQILEAHRPATTTVLAEAESMYATAPLPLGPGPRAALGLARELTTELALGYRITIVESADKLFSSKKQLATLFARAARYTAARLLAAYKSYTPVPTGTWAELHELYLRAEGAGVARERPEGESLAEIYDDALLLSLTDPYRLAREEAEGVLRLLRAHRGHATLGQARPRTAPGGHFVVPCNTDKPPKPALSGNDDTGGPDWRLLDANPMVERLRSLPGRASDTALIAKLVKLWGDPPKRTARRDPGQITVAISMGIDGVGHFVSQESRLDLARQDDMLRRGITMPLAPLPLGDASEPIPVFEWDVVNQSRGGLRVRRLGRTEQPIAVGEVAGIKMPGAPHWAIGVVRWITVFEDGGMEFGLQFLAPKARAVSVSGWGVPSGSGLLFAGSDDSPALLTSPKAFSHLREIEVEDHGDAQLVRPSSVVEVTHRFEIFNVKAP